MGLVEARPLAASQRPTRRCGDYCGLAQTSSRGENSIAWRGLSSTLFAKQLETEELFC